MTPLESTLVTCLTAWLYSGTGLFIFLFLLTHILKRRRSYWLPVGHMVLKILLVDQLLGHILPLLYGHQTWVLALRLAGILLFSVGNYVVIYLTVEGEFLRVALVMVLSELVSLGVLVPFLTLSYTAAGVPVWGLSTFRPTDLLLPPVGVGVVLLLWRLTKPLLVKLRTCPLPAPGLLWAVVFCYVFLGAASMLGSYSDLSTLVVPGLAFYYLAFAFVVLLCQRHTRSLARQRRNLRVQQRIIQANYALLQRQILQMEQNQETIHRQMAELTQAQHAPDQERVQTYLHQLRCQYHNIHAGIYCQDPMLDAVLGAQNQKYASRHLAFSCHLQNYDRGNLPGEDVASMVLALTGFGLLGTGAELTMAGVRNQLVTHFVVSGVSGARRERTQLCRYLRRMGKAHNGSVQHTQTGQQEEYLVLLSQS